MNELTFQYFLKIEFESRKAKNTQYSLRAFARDLDLAPPKLSEILRGKCGLSESSAEKIAPKLGLSAEETKIFIALVSASHARNPIVRDKAQRFVQKFQDEKRFNEITLESFKIISDWHHLAILELTELEDFKSDISWIAKRLNISNATAETALDRLFEFGLLVKDKNSCWKQTQENLKTTSGIPSSEIRKYHRQILNKAEESLLSVPIEMRDFSSMTLPICEDEIAFVQEAIKTFRRDLALKLSKNKKKQRVYNLAIQFFPLDRKEVIL